MFKVNFFPRMESFDSFANSTVVYWMTNSQFTFCTHEHCDSNFFVSNICHSVHNCLI